MECSQHINPALVAHTHMHAGGFTEANMHHFGELEAAKYDDQLGVAELARRLALAMRRAYPFDEESTTVMDYACGTGLISRELAAYTKSIVGVDISQAMIDQFNIRVENQGIPADEMKGVCAELKGLDEELDGTKFDVVVCASAYHHFSSVDDVSRILACFLKPGGTLLVADMMKTESCENILPDTVAHIVSHQAGFCEEDIRKSFDRAQLESFGFEMATSAKVHGKMVDFFIAKGRKPVV